MEIHTASLFNEVIPNIIRTDNQFYFELPTNDDMIEKGKREDGNYYRKLTLSNWERNLKHKIGIEIYIPLSCLSIHHRIIDLYGHDRVLELVFRGSRQMMNNQTQLTFRTKQSTRNVRERWGYVACRAEGLKDYRLGLYVRMSPEEIKRDRDRFQIIKWRESVIHTTRNILESEVKKGNVHKDHASFLRSRVRKMIVRTHEEHIEHKKAIRRLCEMGRKYLELVRERDSE
jgi:hypothetical protein